MKLTLEAVRDFFTRGRVAQRAIDDVLLMQRARTCLARWAAGRARTARAKRRIEETKELLGAIDDWLLKR
jgi:hypothetical protein